MENSNNSEIYDTLVKISQGEKVDNWEIQRIDGLISSIKYNDSTPGKSRVKLTFDSYEDYWKLFDLTENDIYIPDICPVFGYPLEIGVNKKKVQPNSPSLDRIIPERGYVKSNIRVISYKANIMKNNASFEEMIKIGEDGKRLQLQEAKKNE